eukprot:m.27198 g.27198  ORF g.27198 m.27198 type:complete len:89 (-) comp9326_c1_seq2:54-320(-)
MVTSVPSLIDLPFSFLARDPSWFTASGGEIVSRKSRTSVNLSCDHCPSPCDTTKSWNCIQQTQRGTKEIIISNERNRREEETAECKNG